MARCTTRSRNQLVPTGMRQIAYLHHCSANGENIHLVPEMQAQLTSPTFTLTYRPCFCTPERLYSSLSRRFLAGIPRKISDFEQWRLLPGPSRKRDTSVESEILVNPRRLLCRNWTSRASMTGHPRSGAARISRLRIIQIYHCPTSPIPPDRHNAAHP